MSVIYYDIIIIGSGMAGLYSAYNIQKKSPNKSFCVLEKYSKNWIGGRTSTDFFYKTSIVTGAGIGRKDKNPLLIDLMNKLQVFYSEFKSVMDYSRAFYSEDIMDVEKIINKMKKDYKKYPNYEHKTFKQLFCEMYGRHMYNKFILTSGYTDYENADINETLYNYGMDDTKGGWVGLNVPWKELVYALYDEIGHKNFKFSSDCVSIEKIKEQPCIFQIITEDGKFYYSNKVIIATNISGIQKLVPGALNKKSIYQQIHGQPFLRLYAKFDEKSAKIMKKYVVNYTIVTGPLQKIIPIKPDKGVYMISYSDNNNALALKEYLENTPYNRKFFCELLEKTLGIPKGNLSIIAIKEYYWPIGTHYYEPLSRNFASREDFVDQAQHPQKGMIVVGEAVSRYQGWVEGALESVKKVLTKKWIDEEC